ncbi:MULTISPECIES: ArsC/Spx/MgsR family protein [Paraburkholderia]|uniref:Arsenate reductase n=1 Tax=Paraburkholderia dipogonis TaxID=1211383 RepID=A0ABW9AST4_9BURK
MTITIFHNPACSTSRKVLDMQLSPRESLRIQEPAYTDLRLDDDLLSNARIVELMVPNPVLMNRLIVRTPHGIKLCRPAEEVAPLLQPI